VGRTLDLLPGTLELLILKAVSLGPLHGYGVLLRIQQIARDRLKIEQGSLYPALYRLEAQGWIASEWGESENKRKAKYYRLTAAGKRRLGTEAAKWNQMAELMAAILDTAPGEM
jgi:PadR family transcriptional regulator, regulatory protein PadR